MTKSTRRTRDFYQRSTLTVARELLGQRLVKLEEDHSRLSGTIIEVEAYVGTEDLACHARAGRTDRNETMWGPPGHTYVYFIYGMHWMLNIVTEEEGRPAAILIRALLPEEGIPRMMERRNGRKRTQLLNGPAKLCQAFGIKQATDGIDMCDSEGNIFIEEAGQIPEIAVTTGARVGLNNVPEPWKSVPWRFQVLPGSLSRQEGYEE